MPSTSECFMTHCNAQWLHRPKGKESNLEEPEFQDIINSFRTKTSAPDAPQKSHSPPAWYSPSTSIFTIGIIIKTAWLLSSFDHFSRAYQAIPIFYPVLWCRYIHPSLSFSFDSINLSQGHRSWHMPVCPSVFSVHKFHSTFCPSAIVIWCCIPQWWKLYHFHPHQRKGELSQGYFKTLMARNGIEITDI